LKKSLAKYLINVEHRTVLLKDYETEYVVFICSGGLALADVRGSDNVLQIM